MLYMQLIVLVRVHLRKMLFFNIYFMFELFQIKGIINAYFPIMFHQLYHLIFFSYNYVYLIHVLN